MQHLGTKQLETERLILRAFTLKDAPAMFANWADDPEVTKYLTWPTHESVEVSRAILGEWTARYTEPGFYNWAIVPKDVYEPIGSIGVVGFDEAVTSAHIGYCIGRQWWHQGITGEALAAVIRFLFEEVGVNRVDSRHDPHNPNSGRVMAHCGMTREGTMRQADRNNQGICDYTLYAILANEYFHR
ncbi:MAG: GNAT family N-acetyltransferase [Eubacteriales bacterium]|nr:GNAT family N-acetyltransferase [Eubacteriales bacterium]